jgi:LmbE family N-acetylglucosaminyl deacetylase
MATGVFFHAHPDDEAIATGGTMAKAVAAGHRVILVLATRGELGEPVEGVLRDGEELWERRVEESHRWSHIARPRSSARRASSSSATATAG